MKKSLAITAALASSVALGSLAHAADNPFAATPLSGGYQLAQADMKTMEQGDKAMDGKAATDGKAADASCAGKKKADGSCAGKKKADASCAGKKKADASCAARKQK